MVASMGAFALNDALIKSLGGVLPVFQTLCLRTGLVVIFLACMITVNKTWRPKDISTHDKWVMAARALTEVGAAYFIVTALFNMELANMTAILQILPLTIPLAAMIFLKEPLGWRRMVAICIGFAGMLLIVQPGGQGFNAFSFYALGGVVCVTGRDIFARMLGGRASAELLSLQAAMAVFLFSLIAAFWEDWNPVSMATWGVLIGSAIVISIGYIVSVQVMRHGDIGFTAQFRYTGLLFALILGFLFFDEWPNLLTIIGALIVVLTGLFTLYRERRTSDAQAPVDRSRDSP